jgi:hypothetical protein
MGSGVSNIIENRKNRQKKALNSRNLLKRMDIGKTCQILHSRKVALM